MKRSIVLLLLYGILHLTILAPAASPANNRDEEQFVRLYQRLAPATVSLSVIYETAHPLSNPPINGVGAGFCVDQSGTILTSAHVVDGARSITVTLFDGEQLPGELLALDLSQDIAVLRLPSTSRGCSAVTLGDSDSLRVGQNALVVGSPLGLGFTLSSGIISGLGTTAGTRSSAVPRLIQTTAPINPGNSGGPLVDLKGQVIGIATATLVGAQNIGFALPINAAKVALSEFKAKGKITRPWLGITGKFLTEPVIRLLTLPLARGLLIEDVEDESPAAEAGLRPGPLHVTVEGVPWVLGGDILLALNGDSTSDADALTEAWRHLSSEQRVRVELLRNGEHLILSLLPRERPRGWLRQQHALNQPTAHTPSHGSPWPQLPTIVGF